MFAAARAARQIRGLAQPRPDLQPEGSLMRLNRTVSGAARMAFVVLALLTLALPARADLRLDITRGKVEPLPIAIPDLAGGGGEEGQTGRDLTQVISADLERSGLFRPLDPRSFIQNVAA